MLIPLLLAVCAAPFPAIPATHSAASRATGPAASSNRDDAELLELLEQIREKHDLPGLAGAVVDGGEITIIGAVGVRERGSEARFTSADKVHLGSCTKSMTATVAATLVEQNKLRWDSTLAEVFPEHAEWMHAEWKTVTLTQLLSHRSGAPVDLANFPKLGYAILGHTGPTSEARRKVLYEITKVPPQSTPGSKYVYSNMGYLMAAAMMEAVTETDCDTLLVERLFKPLGITGGGFGPPSSKDAVDQPRGHWKSGTRSMRFDNLPYMGPAGRAHMPLADWGKYLAMHLRGGRGEAGDDELGGLLGQGSFNVLHAPVGDLEGNPGDYALGWAVAERPWAGGLVLNHAGSNTAWHCVTWLAPLKDFGVLAVTNQGGDAAAQACDEVSSALIGLHLTRAAKAAVGAK